MPKTDDAIDVSTLTREDRANMLRALQAFAAQRPGLDPRNYISGWNDTAGRSAYRRESRDITRDGHDATTLLTAVSLEDGIGPAEILAACRAYSGRLRLQRTDAGAWHVEYCTGQYWPTEYRRAVCAVLAAALWDHARDTMPQPATPETVTASPTYKLPGGKVGSAGDYLRAHFRQRFGRRIASRWFD